MLTLMIALTCVSSTLIKRKGSHLLLDLISGSCEQAFGTVLAAANSAWSFLLTAMEGWRLSEEHWQGHLKFLYFADIPMNGF
jgi:hypothetical protein